MSSTQAKSQSTLTLAQQARAALQLMPIDVPEDALQFETEGPTLDGTGRTSYRVDLETATATVEGERWHIPDLYASLFKLSDEDAESDIRKEVQEAETSDQPPAPPPDAPSPVQPDAMPTPTDTDASPNLASTDADEDAGAETPHEDAEAAVFELQGKVSTLQRKAKRWRRAALQAGVDPSDVQAAVDAPADADEETLVEQPYKPFPTDALPKVVEGYVRAASAAVDKNTPHAMVAVPMLAALASSIGSSARIKLKSDWTEPPTLWAVVCAPSGTTKSAAFKQAVSPVYGFEREAYNQYQERLQAWDPDSDEAKPVQERYRIGDATPEAVAKILSENPRGVLLARDEVAGWIGSFDRYANGEADLQFWIEIFEGIPIPRDRAGEGNTSIFDPVVSVCGTTQPGTLKDKLADVHFDTGFAPRLMLCMPPAPQKQWTEAGITEESRAAVDQMLMYLHGLADEATEGPLDCAVKGTAKRLWVDFYNEQNAHINSLPEGTIQRSVAAKCVTWAARLALVVHLARKASAEADGYEIDKASMQSGIRIAQWFYRETHRVHDELALRNAARDPLMRFLKALPDERFETAEAKAIAENEGIPRRTMYDWIGKLKEQGKIQKLKRGLYRKL